MKLQRHLHKKASSKSALTPQPNPLQTRPFAPPTEVSPDLQTQRETAEPVGHNFANIPLFAPATPPIQAKLTIGEPGDKYEQEADRVAAQVVRQINTSQSPQLQQEQSLQRQEMPEEEELQMKPEVGAIQRLEMPEEEEQLMQPMLQRKPGGGGIAAPSELETSIQQSRGSGLPISETIREPMEQAFGADFGDVKIHTDTQSDQLNRSIQARAFTTGQDIFFRQGAYEPGSRSGQELIAHELTHVVQQSGSQVQRKQAISPINLGISGSLQALQRAFDKDNPSSYDSDGGHGYSDHGPHTTENQHQERLKSGNTPSGRTADIPGSSSKFATEDIMKTAISKAVTDAANPSIYRGKKRSKKRITLAYNISGAGISYTLDSSDKDKVLATNVDWVVIVLEQTGAGKWDNQYDKIITMFPSATAPAQYDN